MEWALDPPGAAALVALGSVLVGSLGVPFPTTAALVFAGSLIPRTSDHLRFAVTVLLAGTSLAVSGDLVWFLIGRRYGTGILGQLCRLSLTRDACVRRTTGLYAHRGIAMLLVVRFLPGLSLFSAPLAGASGVGFLTFVAYDVAGAAIWIAAGLSLGAILADQVGAGLAIVRQFGLEVGGIAAAILLAYPGLSWLRRWLSARVTPAPTRCG